MSKTNVEDKFFLILGIIFFFIRIWVGQEIGIFLITEGIHDDLLMLQYAHLSEHFLIHDMPYNMYLLKDMGFPVFLQFVNLSGLSYMDCMSVLWFIAAVFMTWLFALVTDSKDRRILFLIYIFVLFMPIAFSDTGRRLYRQAFLSPMYFITLEMMTILFVFYWNKIKISISKLTLFNIIFGVVFTITFYVKEDGVWLLICLTFSLLCSLIKKFFDTDELKKKFIHAVIIFLPLAIFAASTVFYKSINEKYFGVYLINNRTEGELGKFVKNVYKIKSDERTSKIWAPTDAIIKTFETSETLRNNEVLKDRVLHTAWFKNDITKNPIHGDFLNWVMLTELFNSGTCKTASDQELFLKTVNAEIEDAFEKGILQKDNKFQLISSMGGYSSEEIFELKDLMIESYKTHLLMTDYGNSLDCKSVAYSANLKVVVDESVKENFRPFLESNSKFINVDLLAEDTNLEFRKNLANVFFKIYSVINPALFIIAIISLFIVKDLPKNILQYAIPLGFLILSLVYSFAISWFSAFIGYSAVLYYSNGIIPMITIFEIFGAYRIFIHFKRG